MGWALPARSYLKTATKTHPDAHTRSREAPVLRGASAEPPPSAVTPSDPAARRQPSGPLPFACHAATPTVSHSRRKLTSLPT